MKNKKEPLAVVSCEKFKVKHRAIRYLGTRIADGPDVEIVRITAKKKRRKWWEVLPPHLHKQTAETFVCVKGPAMVVLRLSSPDNHEARHRLSRGDTLSVPPNMGHRLFMGAGAKMVIIGTPGTTEENPDWYRYF